MDVKILQLFAALSLNHEAGGSMSYLHTATLHVNPQAVTHQKTTIRSYVVLQYYAEIICRSLPPQHVSSLEAGNRW
jgi:hypothetical protein